MSTNPPPQASPNFDVPNDLFELPSIEEVPIEEIEDLASHFKKGYTSSESWVTAAAIGLVAANGIWDLGLNVESVLAVVLSAVGYATNRTWLKRARALALARVQSTSIF